MADVLPPLPPDPDLPNDPYDLLTPEQRQELQDALRAIADNRRRAEAESAFLPMY